MAVTFPGTLRVMRRPRSPGARSEAARAQQAARTAVDSSAAAAGLRERKKAKTRERISDIATGLFLERGFDEVTVAEVAKAANVSVKTVFNYFGAKEDLLFDREPEWLAATDALLASRGPGRGLIVVLQADVEVRWPSMDFGRWDRLTDEAVAGRRPFYSLIYAHAGLHARRLKMSERLRERFIAAAEFDLGDDTTGAVAAGTLIHAAYDAAGTEMITAILDDRPAQEVVDRARSVGRTGLEALARAYAGTPLVDGPA